MDTYNHHISGFYAVRADAEKALDALIARGFPRERVQIFDSSSPTSQPMPKEDSNAVLKDVLVDGTIGTAVGAGLGGLTHVALVAANVSLFVASPLLAPLVMLGWGAGIGGLLGATAGAVLTEAPGTAKKDGWLSTLVGDAIASGQVVLVVDARSLDETSTAKAVINESVGDCKEVSLA
jgi:hypothetical protein